MEDIVSLESRRTGIQGAEGDTRRRDGQGSDNGSNNNRYINIAEN